jgi:GNAT superfamily N-acetyltransferase
MADRSWGVRDWDTAFFGARIGEATLESIRELDDISSWAAAERLDCVYVRSDGRDVAAITAAIRHGAVLVDLRLTMAAAELVGDARAPVRAADDRDRTWLRTAAAELAKASRFSRDERFAPDRVAEMYRIWVDRCLDEGVVYVAAEQSAFVGARPGAPPSIELVYVAADARGRGLGASALLAAGHALGAGAATVATQTGNIPAQRLYQRLGFAPVAVTAVLHLWLTGPSGRAGAPARAAGRRRGRPRRAAGPSPG